MQENEKQVDAEIVVNVGTTIRFVNDFGKTRMVSIVFRILLAIISGYVAIVQGMNHGVFSSICLYWTVLFVLNMYELALVNVDIERQKAAKRALEKAEFEGGQEQ